MVAEILYIKKITWLRILKFREWKEECYVQEREKEEEERQREEDRYSSSFLKTFGIVFTKDGEYWWVGRAGGQVSWRASLMTFRYSNSTPGTSEKPYALSWLEPWWDLYETFIHVPIISHLGPSERTPFPSLPATKALPQPVWPAGRPIISPSADPITPTPCPCFMACHRTWEEVQNPYHSPICVFQLAFLLPLQLLTLHPQSHWLGSMSPTEAWLLPPNVTSSKRPSRLLHCICLPTPLPGTAVEPSVSGPEHLCLQWQHSLVGCLLAHPYHTFCVPGTQLSPGDMAKHSAGASGSFGPGALSVWECAGEAESLGKVRLCDTIW